MDKVRVALLGTGGYMSVHAKRLSARPDVEIVALGDVSETIVNGFIDRHPAQFPTRPPVFTNPSVMYATARPDAVVIATPHTLHFPHAMQALDAGCHVLVEKPMVTSAPQAHELAAKVRHTGKLLLIGYNTPCFPEFLYLRQSIRDHAYGKLELVTAFLSQNWLKATVGKWRQDPALSGGGEAYDSGAHLFNTLCWTIESPVAEVYAMIDHHGSKVDINSAINVRFDNGVMANVTIAGNCPGNHCFAAYMFEHGHIEVDPCGWGTPWINIWGANGQRVKYPPITGADQTPDDNFIESILDKATPRTTVENGIIQSQLMDAIYESARTGQPVRPASHH